MRDILPILYPVAYKLSDVLETEISKGDKYIDVANWMSRAALEYIGIGGFGYSFSALDVGRTNSYTEDLKSLLLTLNKVDFLRQRLPWAVKLGPAPLRRKLIKLVPPKDVQKLVDLAYSIEGQSKNILRKKRQALEEGDEAVHAQIGKGKDIMSILMKTSKEGDVPESELIAHMSTFIMAGHDTTASATSRMLYELSRHQDVQSRLREEITSARKEHGDLDYDALMALPFLDAVLRETMRLYPPATHINRVTNKDVVLPLLWPLKCSDGKTEIKEIPVRKGTVVWISILGANLSKAIWGEDAEEWKPGRWLEPLPPSVENARAPGVYSSIMTFLGGGRACIGFKVAEMDLKLTLFVLLDKFIFGPGPEISWKMGFVSHPAVVEPGYPAGTVPLKVSLVPKQGSPDSKVLLGWSVDLLPANTAFT